MIDRALRWLPLALIALFGLTLRLHHLAVRPMHADEANQGVKTGELLEHGNYAFDPSDHHGPVLYYAALPIAWLRGEHTLAKLSETTLRLVPALAGTLSIFLLAWLVSPMGRWPTLIAAALLAVSPPAVYYSRYFIQETLLLAFTLGAFASFRQWWRQGTLFWSVIAGTCCGLMLATKASAPLFLFAGLASLFASRPPRAASLHQWRDLAIAATIALLLAAIFYSSFGTHLPGLVDALKVYGLAAKRLSGETGHEKAWWYYFRLFGWHREGGLLWQQVAFSTLALGGFILAILTQPLRFPKRAARSTAEAAFRKSPSADVSDNPGLPGARAAAVYTAIIALVLAASPYKTPWHAIHLVPGMALLAAHALYAIPKRLLAAALGIAVIAMQLSQVNLAVFQRPADLRNPYAYVHSSPDVFKFRPLAETALSRHRDGIVRVIGEEYWPLPWYLRGFGQVGYWSSPPVDCDGALVIATSEVAPLVRSRLHGAYHETLLGLRPGVVCVVFSAP